MPDHSVVIVKPGVSLGVLASQNACTYLAVLNGLTAVRISSHLTVAWTACNFVHANTDSLPLNLMTVLA